MRFIRAVLLLAAVFTLVAALWPRRDRPNAGARAPEAGDESTPHAAVPIGFSLVAGSASIAGTVTETNGVPLATATVCARQTADTTGVTPATTPRCSMVGVDGKYRLSDLPPGRWSVSATAPGHLPLVHHFAAPNDETTLAPQEARTDVDLALSLGGARVEGVVVDERGMPIVGATITATADWADFVTTSDERGVFVADVRAGMTTFVAERAGYAGSSSNVLAPSAVRLMMVRETVLAGRVIDAATQLPIAGARVEPGGGDDVVWATDEPSVLTDEAGRFRIDGLPHGRYRPSAVAIGAKGRLAESIVLGTGEVADDLVIQVAPAHHVQGKVLLDGKTVCRDGWVSLTEKSTMDGGDSRRIDESGTVLFPAIDDGRYELSIECEGIESTPKEPFVVAGDVDGVTWSVPRGLVISGLVVDADGRPVGNATVRASVHEPVPGEDATGAYASSSSDGTFEVGGLHATTYDLGVDSDTQSGLPEPLPITLAEGGDQKGLRVVLPRGGTIEGVVVDPAGKPIAGVRVQAGGVGRRLVDTDPSGKFRLDGVTAGTASFSVASDTGRYLQVENGTKAVDVVEGKTVAARLVVARADGVIRGRVVDATGKGVAGAFVDADRSDYSFRLTALSTDTSVITDATGAFTLRGLEDVPQSMRARAGAQEATLHGVAIGSDVILALASGATLEGTVSLADGTAPQRFTLDVENGSARVREEFAGTNGRFVVRALSVGEATITVIAPQGTGTATATLASSGSASVAVLLSAYRELVGRVVDDRGQPVPYAEIVGVISDDYAKADAAGRFVIERVHGDKVELQVSGGKDVQLLAKIDRAIDPASSATIDVGDVAVQPQSYVDDAPDVPLEPDPPEQRLDGPIAPDETQNPIDEPSAEGPKADD